MSDESSWGDDNELRYSLRSLEKNLIGLNRIFVVGHKPKWLVGVTHIPVTIQTDTTKTQTLSTRCCWPATLELATASCFAATTRYF